MRAPLIAMVLSSVGGAVCAQPVNEGVKELEICFQSARAADAICSDPKNGAAERFDCRQKAAQPRHSSNAWSTFSQDGLPDPFRQKCPLAPSRQRCPRLPLRQKHLLGPFHQRGLLEPWPKAGPLARKKRLPEQVHRKRPLQPSRQRWQPALPRPAHPRGALISLQSHRIQIGS